MQVAPQSPGLAVQLATAGVAACFADLITFPLDTTKVRRKRAVETLWSRCAFKYKESLVRGRRPEEW